MKFGLETRQSLLERFNVMNRRFDFLGVQFSLANQSSAPLLVMDLVPGPGYVCFPDASVVSAANRDNLLMNVLNASSITFPDGKPSQIVAKLRGFKNVTTVSGFHLCRDLLSTNASHYFYGADEFTLKKMLTLLKREYPNADIRGAKAPPFLALDEISTCEQIKSDIAEISDLNPDFVWVGVSSPKQDYLMYYYNKYLPNSIMLGVGGVFLYLSNPDMKSPEWVKKIGLRWLFRLLKEPGRLGRKYVDTLSFLLANFHYFLKLIVRRNGY
jgi:N-acetylglucosaminyldiphosphoundecaprenol N-acetyl-beta-D-mannosaminyltransferase